MLQVDLEFLSLHFFSVFSVGVGGLGGLFCLRDVCEAQDGARTQ